MCGIAGIVDFSGLNRDDATARTAHMTRALRHRGPDGDGLFVDDRAALGHRRLAIIDLEGGRQPMMAPNGRVHLVFNGEIYNHSDLRKELKGRGHRFSTRSDTEVVLVAYLEWGEAAFARLNGMFAIAIWDATEARLLLARDRVGEKPLYWHRHGTQVAFASELGALSAAGLCPDEIDPQSLDCYLTLGFVPAPQTIFRGAKKLRAAHWLELTSSSERSSCYWRVPDVPPRERSLSEALEEFEPLFDDAVRRQMMSDVPLGAFLSGGIDSSLVVSSMARQAARVVTNSIGNADPHQDESPIAREVAAAFHTEHHEFRMEPNAASALPSIARHMDEPIADPSALPTWYVCQMARSRVTVALSGDGGDEAFGGYTFRYAPHVVESRLRARIPVSIRAPVFSALYAAWPDSSRLPRPLRLKSILGNLARSDAEAYAEDLGWLKSPVRDALYSDKFSDSLMGFSPKELAIARYLERRHGGALARSQHADQQLYLTDDVLAKVDRMSMAHSLEVRAPLLDYRILEFAASLPPALKLSGGHGKLLLRALAARRLPKSVVDAPKRGFTIPYAAWLRTDIRDLAESVLFGARSAVRDVVDPSELRGAWNQHCSGARNLGAPLWSMVMLGLWTETRRRG